MSRSWRRFAGIDARLDANPDPQAVDLETETGASRHRAPGTRIEDGRYLVVTGLEHDEWGIPARRRPARGHDAQAPQ